MAPLLRTAATINPHRLPSYTGIPSGIGPGDEASPGLFVVDAELVEALLEGHASAWEALIDRYGALVRSRVADVAEVFHRQNDWSTIDDVTAEVFASLLARDAAVLRCFRCQSSFGTYLAVIATRIARRAIAKAVRQSSHQSDLPNECPSDPDSADASTLLIGREERDRLLDLVDRLPPRQRELVVAFYREEQTYAEISHRFDIPIGSIGTTLRRAEARLREWFDDENE